MSESDKTSIFGWYSPYKGRTTKLARVRIPHRLGRTLYGSSWRFGSGNADAKKMAVGASRKLVKESRKS